MDASTIEKLDRTGRYDLLTVERAIAAGIGYVVTAGSGTRGRMLWRSLLALVVVLVAAGCTTALMPSASFKSTGLSSVSTSEVPHQPYAIGLAPSPSLSKGNLVGWGTDQIWDASTRTFTDYWTPAPGPDRSQFPATADGCDDQLFQVRWQVTGSGMVTAGWTNSVFVGTGGPTKVGDQHVTGTAGWMTLYGCQVPVFRGYPGQGGEAMVAIKVKQMRPLARD